jgi:hypothetical protein
MNDDATRTNVPTTRKLGTSNYGTSRTVVGTQRQSLLDVSKAQADSLVITAECMRFTGIPPGANPNPANIAADFRPVVRVSWGNGDTTVASDFDITYRQRIPIIASSVKAELRIAALPFPGTNTPVGPFDSPSNLEPTTALATAIPAAATATARAFVSEGMESVGRFPTIWLTHLTEISGVFCVGQCRLATLRAFVAGSTQEGNPQEAFLLLFDKAAVPVAGDIPYDGIPLLTDATNFPILGELPMGQTRAWVNGLAYGVSTTPYLYTASHTNVFIVAELLT